MPNPIHIGFTGTRAGMTRAQHEVVRQILIGDWLHHGDCRRIGRRVTIVWPDGRVGDDN